MHIDDIVAFFTGILSKDYVTYSHLKPLFSKMAHQKVTSKELIRNFVKYDTKSTGHIDKESLERIFKKLKIHLSSDDFGDVEHTCDPDKGGEMDYGILVALSTLATDTNRAVARMKNCFELIHKHDISYEEAFKKRGKTQSEDETVETLESLGIPMVHPEVQLVVSKYCSRGKVNVDKMLRDLLVKTTKDSKESQKEFGKGLFKKLCKVRSDPERRQAFRQAVIERDEDMTGHISRRDFQRAVDAHMDLSDEEAALLAENTGFIDGTHSADIDYTYVLKLLYEPLERTAFKEASSILSKVLRGADSIGLKIFVSLLYKNSAASDSKQKGVIGVDSAFDVIKQECSNAEKSTIETLLASFLDSTTDRVYYPEMLSYLSSCSLWFVMHSISKLVDKRREQGYQFTAGLLKMHKKGAKLDRHKLHELFLDIGFLVSETRMDCIFNRFGEGKKTKDQTLKVSDFCDALENLDLLSNRGRERKEISEYMGGDDPTEKRLLQEYDERVKTALSKAFDIFDTKSLNEIAATDLERVLCCVGRRPRFEDINDLLLKVYPSLL